MSWTFEHTWPMPSAADVVFAALTTPKALRQWFAEHVDIGENVDGPFRFWGRHSLETPTAALATQRILARTADTLLRFSWTIAGVNTVVAVRLAPSDDGQSCQLHLQHEVNGALGGVRERELIDDHWRFVMGNLTSFLSGGAGIVLPDFSDPTPVVKQSIMINAPRDVVFQTLVTPELVNQWLGSTTTVIDPRAGGRFEVGWTYKIDGRDVVGGPTRIVEFVENERLTLNWPDWRGDKAVPEQTISFVLHDVDGKTRVDFTHAGFTRTTDISDYPFGWVYFLDQLHKVAERTEA